jgi:hypothetical protein
MSKFELYGVGFSNIVVLHISMAATEMGGLKRNFWHAAVHLIHQIPPSNRYVIQIQSSHVPKKYI